jgi:hypothetical protein
MAALIPFAARLGRRATLDPLEPLWPFLACFAITFAVKPVSDAYGDLTYWWFRFDPDSSVVAILVATGALAALLLAYASRLFVLPFCLLPRGRRDPSLARARLVVLVLVTGAMLGVGFIVGSQSGGFSLGRALSEGYRAGYFELLYGRGYLTVGFTLASFAPAIQTWVAIRSRRRLDAVLAIGTLGLVLLADLVVYSRFLILQTIVTVVVVLHFAAGWFGLRSLTALGFCAALAGGLLGVRRRGSLDPLAALGFLGHTFDSFEFLTPALTTLPLGGELYGSSLVEDLLWTFTPRTLIPDKPEVYGIVAVQNLIAPPLRALSPRASTYPPGFLPEWYANFGAAGVAVIAVAYGVWLRAVREWILGASGRLFPLLLYGGVVLNFTLMFRSSAQYVVQGLLYGLLLYALLQAQLPPPAAVSRRA